MPNNVNPPNDQEGDRGKPSPFTIWGLGIWHLVIVALLLWLIYDLWPIAIGEKATVVQNTSAFAISPTGNRLGLSDLGADTAAQVANAGKIARRLAQAPSGDAVLTHLKTRAQEDGIVPADGSTVAPSTDLATKMVLFLNDRLEDTDLAKLSGVGADKNQVPGLTDTTEPGKVAAHNGRLLAAAFTVPAPVPDTANETINAKHKVGWFQLAATPEQALLLVVLVFGAVGACVHAGMYFVGFVGRSTFGSTWFLYYLFQPFVGGVLAVIFYCILRGGLIQSAVATPVDGARTGINIFFISGISALVGFFSKVAINRMETLFNTIIAASPGTTEAGTAPPKSPTITRLEPNSFSRANPVPAVILHGTNFNSGATVHFDSIESQTVVPDSATQITAAFPPHFQPAATATHITVTVTVPITDARGEKLNKTASKELPVVA